MATVTERIQYVFDGVVSGLSSASRQAWRSLSTVKQTGDAATVSLSQLSRETQGFQQIAQGVGGRVGELGGRLNALASGFGSVGIAGVAAAGAVVGVGVAAYGAFQAIQLGVTVAYDAVQAFDAARDSGLAFGGDVGDRLDGMTAALEGVQVAGGLLVADILTDWEPAVTTFSAIAITGALELRDAWNNLAGGAPTLTDNLRTLAKFGFGGIAEWTERVLRSQATLLDVFGIEQPNALRRFINLADGLDSAIVGALVPAFEDFADTQGVSIDRGRQVIEALRGTGRDAASSTGSVRELSAANRELAESFDAIGESVNESFDAIGESVKKPDTKFAFEFDKSAVLAAEALQMQKQAMSETADVVSKSYAPALTTIGGIFRDLPGLFKEGSLAAFIATKAAALGQSIVNGALAVTNVLANVPAPANIPLAFTVGGIAAAQTGIIAAQPPPSFDIGGIVRGGIPIPGGNPRQVLVQAEVGEEVRTVEQQRQGGGREMMIVPVLTTRRASERIVLSSARSGGIASRFQRRRGLGQRRFAGV